MTLQVRRTNRRWYHTMSINADDSMIPEDMQVALPGSPAQRAARFTKLPTAIPTPIRLQFPLLLGLCLLQLPLVSHLLLLVPGLVLFPSLSTILYLFTLLLEMLLLLLLSVLLPLPPLLLPLLLLLLMLLLGLPLFLTFFPRTRVMMVLMMALMVALRLAPLMLLLNSLPYPLLLRHL
jgi:hypothetical protein